MTIAIGQIERIWLAEDAIANVVIVPLWIDFPIRYAMMLAGLALLGFATRRRKRKVAA